MKTLLDTANAWYLRGVILVLFVLASAKVASSVQDTPLLATPDPLFGFLSVRQLTVIAALTEYGLALVLRRSSSGLIFKNANIAWLSTAFAAYRAGLHFIGYRGSCKCLGEIAGWLDLSDQAASRVTYGLFFLLLVGSYGFLGLQFILSANSNFKGDFEHKVRFELGR